MSINWSIDNISIKGFKSLKEISRFKLGNLNIIIGANGAGKSNFIQIFHMLSAMVQNGFSKFILERGGADNFLFNGPKVTPEMEMEIDFHSCSNESNSYKVVFSPTADEKFLLSESLKSGCSDWVSCGTVSEESRITESQDKDCICDLISNIVVYHFHDTSANAPMRRSEIVEDNKRLRGNASNIAPFLLSLRESYPREYEEIRNAVRLVMPFFDDFILDVVKMGESEKVRLSWKQKGSDFPMQPYHFSDGSIRFICLAVALLQPAPPSIIVIDEPELGLHPAAVSLLAELIHAASKETQVIIATQSPMLIDHFSINDIIVMTRDNGASAMKHLNPDEFSLWLEDYSIGELWAKNVIEGGPVNE